MNDHQTASRREVIRNPARDHDKWAPDFEVGGCWLYRHDQHCYTVTNIDGESVRFTNGANEVLTLNVTDAAKLMRPT